MQKLYVDMSKGKFRHHNPASNKFFANKRVNDRNEKCRRLEENTLQQRTILPIPTTSNPILSKNKPTGIVVNNRIKESSKALKRLVRKIVLSNNLVSKHNKLKYSISKDKIRQRLLVWKQRLLRDRFKFNNNKQLRVPKQLGTKLDPKTMRIYDTRVRLSSKLRLEENIIKRRGRLPKNEWARLEYINNNKVFTNNTHILYKSIPPDKEYNIFLSQTRLNTFLTLTNVAGEVILSRSAGWCGISSKKKKKILRCI